MSVLPSEQLGSLHHTLKAAQESEAQAQRDVQEATKRLKAARLHANTAQETMVDTLSKLHTRPVSVSMLEKTAVGVTVNSLRTHDSSAVAAKATQVAECQQSVVGLWLGVSIWLG